FFNQISQSKSGVGLYTRNSDQIPEREISRWKYYHYHYHGKQFKSYLRMRYFLTKHLISTCCGGQ
ncbi:hypothetical protein LDENG_00262780, partial [Lucifuga dentata]